MSFEHIVKILLTGSDGFIGKHIAAELDGKLADNNAICGECDNKQRFYSIVPCSHKDCDLENYNETKEYFLKVKPKIIIHCAGYNGGIAFNAKYPSEVFYRNTVMGLNVFKACRELNHPNIRKLITFITSCAYPDKEILKENEFWDGLPHESIRCHGMAKRNLVFMNEILTKQFPLPEKNSFRGTIVCPNTVFGPGDTTDPIKTKVMMALIKKFEDARTNKDPEVVCWGDGAPMREFVYVKDVARIINDIIKLPHCDFINVASEQEKSIKELSELVAKLVGYEGKIVWDSSKPNGQMRKKLDSAKMRSFLPNFQFTPLEEAVKETIEWYRSIK